MGSLSGVGQLRSRRWCWTAMCCLLQAACPQAQSSYQDGSALLGFSQAMYNWQSVAMEFNIQGWRHGQDPCQGWTGVTCDQTYRVADLSLPFFGIEGPLDANLTLLDNLHSLNLSGNALEGPLPAEWGLNSTWPRLTSLSLDANPSLESDLPTEWATSGGFQQLKVLQLSSCAIDGLLPAAWGSKGSFPSLEELDLGNNTLSGTLPQQWADSGSLPQLQILGLSGNQLAGTLPAQWGVSQTALPGLQVLELANNSLTGSLPPQWGTNGYQALQVLDVSSNQLAGSLPQAWAASGRFPNMSIISLQANNLSGSVPASWGSPSYLRNLSQISILPGNDDICGAIPGYLGAFRLNSSAPGGAPVRLDATQFFPCSGTRAVAGNQVVITAQNSWAAQAPAGELVVALLPLRIAPAPAPAPVHTAAAALAPSLRAPAPAPSFFSAPAPGPGKLLMAPTPAPAPVRLPSAGLGFGAPAPAPQQLGAPAPAPSSLTAPAPAPMAALSAALQALAPAPAPEGSLAAPAPAPQLELTAPAPAPQPDLAAPAPAPEAEAALAPVALGPALAPGPGGAPVNLEITLNLVGQNLYPINQQTRTALVTAFSNTVGNVGRVQLLRATDLGAVLSSAPAPAPEAQAEPSRPPSPAPSTSGSSSSSSSTGSPSSNSSTSGSTGSGSSGSGTSSPASPSSPAAESAPVLSFQARNAPPISIGRRMLQAASAHNISATFAYDTTPTVAASFPGTFTADRYTYQLQQQGIPGVSTLIQNVQGVPQAALELPVQAPTPAPTETTPPATTAAPQGPATPSQASTKSSSSSLSTGAIAGIAIGAGIILALLLALVIFCCVRRRRRQQAAPLPSSDKAGIFCCLCRRRQQAAPQFIASNKAGPAHPGHAAAAASSVKQKGAQPSADSGHANRQSPTAVVGAGPVGPLLPSRQATAGRQPSRRLVPADMMRSEEGGLSDIDKAEVAGRGRLTSQRRNDSAQSFAAGQMQRSQTGLAREHSSSDSPSESGHSGVGSSRETSAGPSTSTESRKAPAERTHGLARDEAVGAAPVARPMAGGLHRQGSRERLLRRGAGDSPTYGARPTSQPRSTSQPRTPSANPELVVNAPAVRKFLAQHQGELSGRTDQDRLLALSRRARQALERELQGTHRGVSSRGQRVIGDALGRDERGSLSDRAIRILEEISNLGVQGRGLENPESGRQTARSAQAAGAGLSRGGSARRMERDGPLHRGPAAASPAREQTLHRQRSGVGFRGLASQPSAGTRDMQRGLSSLLRQTASGQIAADLLAAPEARRASPAPAERAPRGAHRSHRAWGSSGSLAQDNRPGSSGRGVPSGRSPARVASSGRLAAAGTSPVRRAGSDAPAQIEEPALVQGSPPQVQAQQFAVREPGYPYRVGQSLQQPPLRPYEYPHPEVMPIRRQAPPAASMGTQPAVAPQPQPQAQEDLSPEQLEEQMHRLWEQQIPQQ
eukprot:jgi/Astpho2/6903/fgenesh1_pg.00106_%23_17_t